MPLAIAIEMIQTMSLIHDDLPCMDDDDLHRGKPSNLRVLGKPIDILTDDAFLTLAFDHLVDPTSYLVDDLIPPAHIVCMVAKLSRSIELEGLVIGAMVDIESTGLIELLQRYARRIGLLFQVIDDILDVTQSLKKLGKMAGKDLISDKTIYQKLMGLKESREYIKELLKNAVIN
uniref:Heterodimeric geranylgeranyl pyrophosphate synthase large subunit 1, chloroplastic-like n=1 Tax=Elaeis guineensis var. tenera TaxID=51953 RepID=A0A8N4F9X1_ELAGV|nr:heterodimeric geranylgeranyl pyrophosphate synthase large subunit 1, chloroplastic-like [Elaeis guineensis]